MCPKGSHYCGDRGCNCNNSRSNRVNRCAQSKRPRTLRTRCHRVLHGIDERETSLCCYRSSRTRWPSYRLTHGSRPLLSARPRRETRRLSWRLHRLLLLSDLHLILLHCSLVHLHMLLVLLLCLIVSLLEPLLLPLVVVLENMDSVLIPGIHEYWDALKHLQVLSLRLASVDLKLLVHATGF